MGVGIAAACAVGVPRLTRNLESRGARRRREQLARQAPVVADLLAATIASGSTMRPALAAVGDAVGDPARAVLRPVLAEIDLGADPGDAWRALVGDRVLGPIAASVVRSMETGAPLSSVLARIAEDMRRDRQVAVEVAARAAGVKAVAPLAACFLPAFLLLGVVPVVAALASSLLSS
jgi:Flp pilus assembly protein TadB